MGGEVVSIASRHQMVKGVGELVTHTIAAHFPLTENGNGNQFLFPCTDNQMT